MAETSLPRLTRILGDLLAASVRTPLPAHTSRRIFGPAGLPGKATAIVGMRRAGKTTFLHQLRRERIERGAPRERLPYLSFEDERLAGLDASHLGLLVNEYHRRFPGPDGTAAAVTWCFDEIQIVPGWERFVRRLLDGERAEVFLTGSSSALLSREIATALRGRAWQVLIHPFSFEEALRHRGSSGPEDPGSGAAVGHGHGLRRRASGSTGLEGPGSGAAASLTDRGRSWLERALLDWLEAGGFPEVQGLDAATRQRLLRDYVDVAMLRDVVERHEVRNVAGLRWLVRHLLGNAGSPFSVEKFHGALKSQGIAIARDTLHQLLSHLEDCFLVRVVWMESNSERQRMVNPRKAYPVDPGLIPVFDRTGRANTGHALETAVLVELERRGFEVTYLRTPEGYEVDFLARAPSGGMELVQVCADLSDPATAARELRALAAGGVLFPRARKRLLTLTQDGLPAEAPADVEVQAAREWLLAPPQGVQAAEVEGCRSS